MLDLGRAGDEPTVHLHVTRIGYLEHERETASLRRLLAERAIEIGDQRAEIARLHHRLAAAKRGRAIWLPAWATPPVGFLVLRWRWCVGVGLALGALAWVLVWWQLMAIATVWLALFAAGWLWRSEVAARGRGVRA